MAVQLTLTETEADQLADLINIWWGDNWTAPPPDRQTDKQPPTNRQPA